MFLLQLRQVACPNLIFMSKKKTFEEVKKYIENEDYILLSKNYKNQLQKLEMICNKGHKCSIAFKYFSRKGRGVRCNICNPNRKKTLEEIKKEIQNRGYVLLSEYLGTFEKIKIKCKNGHISETTWNQINFQGKMCTKCLKNPKFAKDKIIIKKYKSSDRGIYARYKHDCNRRGRLKRNITMSLNFEEFSSLINSNCYFCGEENCRGVDRIDSSKGYTLTNSRPCCSRCNEMKNNYSDLEFLSHLKKIIKKMNIL
jgi:hypothetical protein